MNAGHDIVRYTLVVTAPSYLKLLWSVNADSDYDYRYVLHVERIPSNECGRIYNSYPIKTNSKSEFRLKMAVYGLVVNGKGMRIARSRDSAKIVYAVLDVVPTIML